MGIYIWIWMRSTFFIAEGPAYSITNAMHLDNETVSMPLDDSFSASPDGSVEIIIMSDQMDFCDNDDDELVHILITL
eukprot:8861621-Ditylum_brightwellii.AAC.1